MQDKPVQVTFALSKWDDHTEFKSTLLRELAFAAHHAIHHHAMIKHILLYSFPSVAKALPKHFGKAPATEIFERD